MVAFRSVLSLRIFAWIQFRISGVFPTRLGLSKPKTEDPGFSFKPNTEKQFQFGAPKIKKRFQSGAPKIKKRFQFGAPKNGFSSVRQKPGNFDAPTKRMSTVT